MFEVTVDLKLSGFERIRRRIAGLSRSEDEAVRRALQQWALIYRSFAMQRYERASRGDGTWVPLSPRTIAARRKGRNRATIGDVMILRDTGITFAALTPTMAEMPGALTEEIPFGIRVGYGGPSRHGNGLATIADIAAKHDKGIGVPQRKIIVEPPSDVVEQMQQIMIAALTS